MLPSCPTLVLPQPAQASQTTFTTPCDDHWLLIAPAMLRNSAVVISLTCNPVGSVLLVGLLAAYGYRFQLCGFAMVTALNPAGSGCVHLLELGLYSRWRKS